MRRELDINLNRDRHYPRVSPEYFRKRWTWRTMLTNEAPNKPFAIYEGQAAFAVTALIKAHLPRVFGKDVTNEKK